MFTCVTFSPHSSPAPWSIEESHGPSEVARGWAKRQRDRLMSPSYPPYSWKLKLLFKVFYTLQYGINPQENLFCQMPTSLCVVCRRQPEWAGGGHCRSRSHSGPRRGEARRHRVWAAAGAAGSGHLAAAETLAVVSDRREVRQRGRRHAQWLSDNPEWEPGSSAAPAHQSHLRSRSRRQWAELLYTVRDLRWGQHQAHSDKVHWDKIETNMSV